ncbi:MAG: hypothetical protein ACYS8K_05390, partial [Planctomycetota bacterium]
MSATSGRRHWKHRPGCWLAGAITVAVFGLVALAVVKDALAQMDMGKLAMLLSFGFLLVAVVVQALRKAMEVLPES